MRILKRPVNYAAVVLVLLAAFAYYSSSETDNPPVPAMSESVSSSAENVSSHSESAHDAYKDYNWAHKDTLDDHFSRHGGDFDATDAEDYARMANEFYLNRDSFEVKVDADGILRIYDPETNTFGAYNKSGSTRSFFKPSNGQSYFDRQPGERE